MPQLLRANISCRSGAIAPAEACGDALQAKLQKGSGSSAVRETFKQPTVSIASGGELLVCGAKSIWRSRDQGLSFELLCRPPAPPCLAPTPALRAAYCGLQPGALLSRGGGILAAVAGVGCANCSSHVWGYSGRLSYESAGKPVCTWGPGFKLPILEGSHHIASATRFRAVDDELVLYPVGVEHTAAQAGHKSFGVLYSSSNLGRSWTTR